MNKMKSDTLLKDLYDANYARLYKLTANRLRLYTGHTSDVQDVPQDVFLEAARKNICNHPNPEGWFFLTTVNFCKNYTHTGKRINKKRRNLEQAEMQKSDRSSLLFVGSEKDEPGLSDIRISLEQILSGEELGLLDQYCLKGRNPEDIEKELRISSGVLRPAFSASEKRSKNTFRDM